MSFGDLEGIFGMSFAERLFESVAAGRFSMNQKDLLFTAGDPVEVGHQLAVICMTGEGIENLDAGGDMKLIAEDGDILLPFAQFPAQGLFSTVTYKQDGGVGISNVIAQVVKDASGLAHAGGGDDDRGFLDQVDALGFLHRADKTQAFKSEGIVAIEELLINRFVETLGMQPENFGGADRERAVHKDGQLGKTAGLEQFMQLVEKLLGSFNGKGGDDDLAISRNGFVDDMTDMIGGLRREFVSATAIRAFHDDVVHSFTRGGAIEQIIVGSAHITGEKQPGFFSCLAVVNIQHHLSRTKDVPGIDEGELDALRDEHGTVVANGHELTEAFLGIELVISCLKGWLSGFNFFPVEPGYITFLNVCRVGQHHGAKVARCIGGENVAAESLLGQVGKIAAVIDVRMRKHHDIDGLGIEGKFLIDFKSFRTPALIEAAIEEDALAVDVDQVLRSRGRTCSTMEGNFHS